MHERARSQATVAGRGRTARWGSWPSPGTLPRGFPCPRGTASGARRELLVMAHAGLRDKHDAGERIILGHAG
jgi:hypothetical protein